MLFYVVNTSTLLWNFSCFCTAYIFSGPSCYRKTEHIEADIQSSRACSLMITSSVIWFALRSYMDITIIECLKGQARRRVKKRWPVKWSVWLHSPINTNIKMQETHRTFYSIFVCPFSNKSFWYILKRWYLFWCSFR